MFVKSCLFQKVRILKTKKDADQTIEKSPRMVLIQLFILKIGGKCEYCVLFPWFKQWNFNNIDKIVGCFFGIGGK